jgi:hypothetical protein
MKSPHATIKSMCGIPRMNYLTRTTRPSALTSAVHHSDRAVREHSIAKAESLYYQQI